jgi:hypothetical protein
MRTRDEEEEVTAWDDDIAFTAGGKNMMDLA